MAELTYAAMDQQGQIAVQAAPSAVAVPRLGPDGLQLHGLAALLTRSGYAAAQELRRTGGPSPLHESYGQLQTLRRLFWGKQALPRTDCIRALAPLDVSALIRGGLLQADGDEVRALFQIQVYDGLYFIVDFIPGEEPADVVLPIGPSSKYLAAVTIRRPAATALDLGCGCGIQALLLSRHADRVTATDINPRAVALTRLNAELNGITNVETLEGSFFEPIADRRFDLVVANLPYVITPEVRYVYRDLGGGASDLIRRNIEELPRHLSEGGYGHVMLNWIHEAKQAWWEPIEAWTKQRNADGWLLYSHSQTPEEYAKQWNTIDAQRRPEEHARQTREWTEWYAAQGIQRIAFGLLTLRGRTAQNNWRCAVRVFNTANEPLGTYVQYLFDMQDYLAGVRSPAELLGRRLRPRLMKVESPARGIFAARTTRGFLIRAEIHALTAQTIPHLDGTRNLKTAIETALRGSSGAVERRADLICGEIYQLMNLGMIEPA